MQTSQRNRFALVAGAAVLAAPLVAAPVLAAETYPPSPSGNNSNSNTGGNTNDASPAYTGSDATVVGLIAGLAAVGVGGGLVVAARRKRS